MSTRRRGRSIILASWMVVFSAASLLAHEGLAPQEWYGSPSPGTIVRDYQDVPVADRVERIEFVEDLIVDEPSPAQPEADLRGAAAVTVDDAGTIYVVNRRTHQIQVFDADGGFVRVMGRPGQGPGDFQLPMSAAALGDALVVEDRRNGRHSIWDLDGHHIASHNIDGRKPEILRGTTEGEIVGVVYGSSRPNDDVRFDALGAYDVEGNRLRVYFELPFDWTPSVELGWRRIYDIGDDVLVPRPRPTYAAADDGTVYASPANVYQLASKSPEGALRWVVRVQDEPLAFVPSRERTERFFREWGRRHPELRESHVNWPEFAPAIERLEVDGRGNVYVVPWTDRLSGVGGDRPVDVYSPDGERLFTGLMPDFDWSTATGNYVYTIEPRPNRNLERVVRYRLITPY